MTGNCKDCRFWMQAETRSVCGHSLANADGNGNYIYHNFTCDIDKFEPRELPFNQEKERCAKEHGWTFLKTEDEIDYYIKS